MDERCLRLIAGTARYNALAAQLTEKYLSSLCSQYALALPLCKGDYDALSSIAQAEGTTTMVSIARKLGVNPSSVTRNVKKLLEDNLISKIVDPADERRFQLTVTELGAQICKSMAKKLEDAVTFMYADVTPEQMQIVFGFSDHCASCLEALINEE